MGKNYERAWAVQGGINFQDSLIWFWMQCGTFNSFWCSIVNYILDILSCSWQEHIGPEALLPVEWLAILVDQFLSIHSFSHWIFFSLFFISKAVIMLQWFLYLSVSHFLDFKMLPERFADNWWCAWMFNKKVQESKIYTNLYTTVLIYIVSLFAHFMPISFHAMANSLHFTW